MPTADVNGEIVLVVEKNSCIVFYGARPTSTYVLWCYMTVPDVYFSREISFVSPGLSEERTREGRVNQGGGREQKSLTITPKRRFLWIFPRSSLSSWTISCTPVPTGMKSRPG